MYNSSHPHPQVPERIFDWRAHLPIHQAAELFPLMPEDELRALADDIEKNGLRELVTIWKVDGRWHLLDGRNRLDALVLLGRDILIMGEPIFGTVFQEAKPKPDLLDPPFDPFAFVISKNIVRRHLNLTSEQKRELTIKVLKLDPGRSNREIAKMVHRDGKTVAKDRGKLEATAEIPQLTKTKGKDGKARPARRKTAAPKTAKKAPVTTPPEESAEESRERMKAGFHAAESKTAETPGTVETTNNIVLSETNSAYCPRRLKEACRLYGGGLNAVDLGAVRAFIMSDEWKAPAVAPQIAIDRSISDDLSIPSCLDRRAKGNAP